MVDDRARLVGEGMDDGFSGGGVEAALGGVGLLASMVHEPAQSIRGQ